MIYLQPYASWLTITGLSLDIVGVVLLYFFGLPSKLTDRSGKNKRNYGAWVGRKATPAEIRLYEWGSASGIGLLVFGFLLQMVGAAVDA